METIDGGEIKEIKNISGRRSIRDDYNNYEEISSRKKANIHKDRSISEPPKSIHMNNNNHNRGSAINRLKAIREKHVEDVNNQGSSEEDNDDYEEDFSKSNSQLNESDLDLDIPESASHTPTPTLLTGNARRINSETNLNDSKRRLTGFMGNRSKRFCASTSELNFASHLDTHKSLFSPKNNQNSRSGSLYGSNMSLNSTNSRLFMTNCSPFYNGKTMFGGASSYPKRDINQHKVLRTPIQMRPSSSLSNSSNTSTKSEGAGAIMPESSAAKRILEIMTQFSGPLKETRNMGSNINSMIKIPGLVQNRKRFGEEDLQLDRSISLTRPTAPYNRPIATSISTKNQQPESPSILLGNNSKTPQIPTMSQLLKMKRLQNNTEKVREIANRSENFLNQNHEYKLPSQTDEIQQSSKSNNINLTMNTNNSSSSAFKIKSNITKNLLRNDKGIETELPPAPLNLPNIQLPQLKSIPKFDIIKLPESSTSATTTTNKVDKSPSIASFTSIDTFKTATDMSLTEKNTSKTTIKNNNIFIFSKPIRFNNTSDADDYKNLKITTDSFKFSKPIFIKENAELSKTKTDIQPTKTVSDNLFRSLVAQQKTLWECESCMTRNDMDRTKCLCCDTLKRDSGISSQSSSIDTSATPKADDLFKKLAAQQKKSQWDCSECMTKNDLDKEKCLCCEAPKPGSKPSATLAKPTFQFGMPPSSTKSDDLFKSLAAQQKKSQWECTDCMTSNDLSKDKCLCCEAPKPGSENTSKNQSTFSSFSTTSKFSFGMPASASLSSSPSSQSATKIDPEFKKIIEKQNVSWECSACMTRNDQSRSKCICCEQSKPGSSDSKSHFSFGSKISSTVALPAPSEVKFSFGMQPVQPSKSEWTITTDDSKTKNEDKIEKTDEVDKPTFKFGAVTSSTSSAFSAPTFIFKTPTPSISTTQAISSPSFTIKSPPKADEEKKENEKNDSTTTDNCNKLGTDKPLVFSFGNSNKNDAAEKTVQFGANGKSTVEDNANKSITSTSNTSNVEEKKSGGFSFPIATNSSAVTDSSSALKTNGGFTFGASLAQQTESKKEEKKPISAGGFSFSSGSSTTTITQPTNTFTFGSTKPNETSDQSKPAIFGSFGNTQPSSAPVFGQNPVVPSFGSNVSITKKDETKPVFAFGTTASNTNNSNMIFGSNLANSTASFGSSFSSISSNVNNNNNESGFGSKMVPFGNIQQPSINPTNQSQKRAFDFSSSDVPQQKKFDFDTQQKSQSQPNSTPFQFNAQPEATAKPAFNFSSTTPQTFNFSGINNNNTATGSTNAQENLFQFGANSSTTTQGIFAFGVNAQPSQQPTPVMQFGATSAPTIAIPGINTFGAQQNTPQRKILRAARRTNRR